MKLRRRRHPTLCAIFNESRPIEPQPYLMPPASQPSCSIRLLANLIYPIAASLPPLLPAVLPSPVSIRFVSLRRDGFSSCSPSLSLRQPMTSPAIQPSNLGPLPKVLDVERKNSPVPPYLWPGQHEPASRHWLIGQPPEASEAVDLCNSQTEGRRLPNEQPTSQLFLQSGDWPPPPPLNAGQVMYCWCLVR